MLRPKSNCSVIEVDPSPLVDVICARPGMAENCCSSGVTTEAAIVAGLAPGRLADTTMVGKSTLGSAAIGNSENDARPNTRRPAISRAVAIGRRMKTSAMLIGGSVSQAHLDIVSQPVLSVHYDSVPSGQALFDHRDP